MLQERLELAMAQRAMVISKWFHLRAGSGRSRVPRCNSETDHDGMGRVGLYLRVLSTTVSLGTDENNLVGRLVVRLVVGDG